MGWLDRLRGKDKSIDAAMAEAAAAVERGDHQAALAIWGPLAHAGVPRAQNNIGACFAEGLGVERDAALALRWLTLSAEAGDPVGQRNLAALHFKGEGVEQSDAEAMRLYRLAAEQGDAPAQDMLSWMLLETGQDADRPEAFRWAGAAAEAGIAASMTRLGMIHHDALGVERDPALAAQWWQRGAAAGDADAKAMLGAAVLLGQGIEKDAGRALVLLTEAEREGSLLAAPFLKAASAAASEGVAP
ncbi:tetratricopeptide repeat protein [Bosea sp. BH3]|uniref:tetratricopeptide repeat protein n=1 Tax=Bosea sp. BH3 TaxID=2871701 RepID=UPI0021CB7FE9|nr:tetratricopeptide repeat protein [Bosea sp. BH3]MCU4182195.1 sel1 repeat family protein [Bosea sp. BH3]